MVGDRTQAASALDTSPDPAHCQTPRAPVLSPLVPLLELRGAGPPQDPGAGQVSSVCETGDEGHGL